MSTWDDIKAAVDKADSERDAARAECEAAKAGEAAAVARAVAAEQDRDNLRAEYDAHMATHEPEQPTVLMGMSTEWDRWDERVQQTGPVALRRCFTSSWSPDNALGKIRECHAAGVMAYASIKTDGGSAGWAEMASGGYDARIDSFARDLAALGYPIRLALHHEPRGGGISTPTQLAPWSRAHTRFNQRIKAIAPNVIVGPCDNGFMWPRDTGWNGNKLTDAELAVYYTDEFLASCDVLGCDTYDGATDTSEGEPAWRKMLAFSQWAARRGFTGKLDIGEWNVVKPEDIDAAWSVLSDPANRFWAASLFNSAANNRTDLPAELNGSWVLTGERLAAFRAVLDQAIPGR